MTLEERVAALETSVGGPVNRVVKAAAVAASLVLLAGFITLAGLSAVGRHADQMEDQ